MKLDKLQEIAMFALNALKTAKDHEGALKSIVGRIGTAVGGATQSELETALDDAVAARKRAGSAMHDAGRFKP